MKTSTYKELSNTPDGRKQAHDMMLDDVKVRMDNFVSGAPEITEVKYKKCLPLLLKKYRNLAMGTCFVSLQTTI